MAKKELTYQEAVEEIEAIIERIEEDSLDVDKLTGEVARAIKLIKYCKEKLRSTEKDIDQLLEDLSD